MKNGIILGETEEQPERWQRLKLTWQQRKIATRKIHAEMYFRFFDGRICVTLVCVVSKLAFNLNSLHQFRRSSFGLRWLWSDCFSNTNLKGPFKDFILRSSGYVHLSLQCGAVFSSYPSSFVRFMLRMLTDHASFGTSTCWLFHTAHGPFYTVKQAPQKRRCLKVKFVSKQGTV